MLRITVTEGDFGQKWLLQGRLGKSSVSELVSHWNARQNPSVVRIVDLSEITSIDKAGERVLWRMIRDGAQFVTAGVYTAYILEELRRHPPNADEDIA
jgi:ABC-type transporter Mla MlaB component